MRTLIFILCMLIYLLLLGYLGAYVTDKICEQSSSYSKVCRMVDVSEPHIPSELRPSHDK
ncbi:hypothetical protein CEQ31_008080 [Serratia odorifera]|nr:hypothetical protein CEQ31_008080 [Serratia odorifera]RII70977.1 hypothetical protein DX901_18240 [Serratia odorifera]